MVIFRRLARQKYFLFLHESVFLILWASKEFCESHFFKLEWFPRSDFSWDNTSGSRTARRTFEFGRTHVVKPKGKHQATIVWLHGLSDNGLRYYSHFCHCNYSRLRFSAFLFLLRIACMQSEKKLMVSSGVSLYWAVNDSSLHSYVHRGTAVLKFPFFLFPW